ncbi:MAG TPA: hypothetical protein VN622_14265 [Clostridia bacterium]|nr:hypothetical protein [Clostridia bacterium]
MTLSTNANGNPALLRSVLMTTGASGGCIVGYLLVAAFRAEPKLIVESVVRVLSTWGPLFVIVLVGMIYANRWAEAGVRAIEKNAEAQQQLATAVTEFTHKDDQRARETELVLDSMSGALQRISAQQSETHNLVVSLSQQMEDRARGAGA